MNLSRHWAAAAAGLCFSAGVWAADPVVLLEVGGVKVTDQDVIAAIPPGTPDAQRAQMLQSAQGVTQTAKNLAARRLLAQEAQKNGLAAQPMVKARQKLADEKVLSDARLVQFEAEHAPNAKAVDDYARAEYKANPKAFTQPEETRVRHILIEGDTPESRDKAEKLLAQIKGGADFAKLATDNSQDPGSAAKGGDLGFAPSSRYVPEFGKAMDELKNKGDVSGLVQTKFGWHILKLEERRPSRVVPYEEVADKLKADATKRLVTDKRLAMTNGLIKDAKINEDAVKALGAAAPAKKK
ncbi:peptidylprolyl isomerase [Diaphorobacter ruginosibacter]|uniref:peptidylprolyl isomerase n=1 Tax=Diaphorobacter ruginosibacter TaxID=1715720 RepID=UPI00333F2563